MSGPSYDPVPWSTDHADDVPYSTRPLSLDTRHSTYQTPETEPLELHDDLPPGAARPRFLGKALAHEGPSPRDSYASSQNSFPITDDYNSSVYALNDGTQGSSREPNFYGLNYRDDPGDFNGSEATVGMGKMSSGSLPYLREKRAAYAAPRARSKRRYILIGSSLAGVAIIIGVVLGVYFGIVKPNSEKSGGTAGAVASGSASATPSSSSPSSPGTVAAVVTGGDGSKVTMQDGSTFTYTNSFGGYWYWDQNDPFNNGARAQSFTPALNETFRYGIDQIRGVNLGGWLNTEPFITPALYEKYANASTPAIDEYTLSQNMAADTANGGLNQLEDHYKTFITEQDFAEIAAAGLNFVRIPLPYWAIETRENEPFLAKTCWTYFLKAIQWARKYGIRINIDLHALPGSQNGWNHSGKLGSINILNGPMGIANAQRSLDYIRILAEFMSQPQYKDVVVMFGVTNEPQAPTFGQENLIRYYLQAYNLVRAAGGVGEGNGPFISFHEGFTGLSKWAGTFTNSDRTSLDIHPYLCFGDQSSDGYDKRVSTPCSAWGTNQNDSMSTFGLTTAGEFSNAINDCGLYVNGIGLGTRYEGTYTSGTWPRIGSCNQWTDYTTWNQAMKDDIKAFALSSMDALQNYFFWTWKIGNSSITGNIESPAWSYQLGLQEGWMPTDPRQAAGSCDSTDPFKGPLQSWQTGGAGADQIPASFSSSYAWPPTSISNAGAATLLPTYTPTGTIPTLAVPTFTQSAGKIDVGTGWENSTDSASMNVAISSCSYLDPWVGPTAPPSPLCSGNGSRRNAIPPPSITTPPSRR